VIDELLNELAGKTGFESRITPGLNENKGCGEDNFPHA